ncbi:MAG TPA: serine hydroxymethyltransferase, partial [Holosporales bacterium]|nr:serine hydroxymethyltransferase [Holosporales bacterium]
MPQNGQKKQGVIFEFIQLGNCIKVVAIDTVTGIEVTIIGPTTASQTYL